VSEPGYTEISGRDGVIVRVFDDYFVLRHMNEYSMHHLEELSDRDRGLVKLGAKFSYSEGWLVTPDGHKSRVATIRFKGDDNVDKT